MKFLILAATAFQALAWTPPEGPQGLQLLQVRGGPRSELTSFVAQEEEGVASFVTKRLAAPDDERHPFWRFEWDHVHGPQVAICSFVLLLAGLLCSAGGIGGGGIYVSVLMVAGALSPRDAVPLSKAIVFCGSLASLALNVRRTHNDEAGATRPVIDYEICRIVVPAALIGTLLGVLFNHNAADSFIVLLLCGILLIMSAMVLVKTAKQYKEEEAQLAQAAEHASAEDILPSHPRAPLTSTSDSKEKKSISKSQKSASSQDVILGFLMLAVVVTSGVVRHHAGACLWELEQHGPGRATGLNEACHHPLLLTLVGHRMEGWMSDPMRAGWAMLLTLVLPISACMLVMAFYSKSCLQQAHWKPADVATYVIMGMLTGCLAGLVGVGGGLIFSPFFLAMGVDPMVAVATSSTCVIFTSSSTTLQYLLTDRIIVSLTVVYGLVNLVASYAGTAFVHFLQDRFSGRKSYVTGIVALGVLVSAVLSVTKLTEGATAAAEESLLL